MNQHNLITVASRLKFAPRAGDLVSENIYDVKSSMILPVPHLSGHEAEMLKSMTGRTVLVIEKKDEKKRIYSNAKYVIARPAGATVEGREFHFTKATEALEVLREGWTICRAITDVNFAPIFVPSDADSLTFFESTEDGWKALVAAVINLDIERNSEWSTEGAYGENLVRIMGTDKVMTEEGPISAGEYAYDFVNKRLEAVMNEVFTFIAKERAAFYYATPVAQGISISRFADARAFIWHFQTIERQMLEEQAREDGLI